MFLPGCITMNSLPLVHNLHCQTDKNWEGGHLLYGTLQIWHNLKLNSLRKQGLWQGKWWGLGGWLVFGFQFHFFFLVISWHRHCTFTGFSQVSCFPCERTSDSRMQTHQVCTQNFHIYTLTPLVMLGVVFKSPYSSQQGNNEKWLIPLWMNRSQRTMPSSLEFTQSALWVVFAHQWLIQQEIVN